MKTLTLVVSLALLSPLSAVETTRQIQALQVTPSDAKAIDAAISVADQFQTALDNGDSVKALLLVYQVEVDDYGSNKKKMPIHQQLQVTAEIERRKALGKTLERILTDVSVSTTDVALNGGRFITLTYQLNFEKKTGVSQTVVVKADGDQANTVIRAY